MKALLKFIIVSLVFILSANTSKSQITIVVNNGKFKSVEEAAVSEDKVSWWDSDLTDDRACTESFAATELASFLKLCTEAEIRFASPENLPAKGDVFILGSSQSNSLLKTDQVKPGTQLNTDQSFRILSLRTDGRVITTIEGKERSGTLYGVYTYLEQLGFRFYGLGEKGTIYPGKISALPENLDIIQNPSFLFRGFHGLSDRAEKDFYLWMARNKLNYLSDAEQYDTFFKKIGMVLVSGGHNIQGLFLSPKAYFDAHPEWYGLRNGKRSPKADVASGDNYCTSNINASRELAKNLVQSLIDGKWKNTDIINFWMLDNGKWCECDNCKKQGILSDRLMDVAYIVQKEIQKAQKEKRLNRNIYLSTLAYHETLPPPERNLPKDFDYDHFFVTFFPIERCYVHSLADPKCTEINQHLLKSYQGWTMDSNRKYKGFILIGEYFNVSSFKSMPIVFPSIMASDIPWYYRTGTRAIHYMHTPTHLWGTWTLNQFLYSKLLWDAEAKSDSLVEEFFRKYYPTTHEITRKFYGHLETAFSNLKTFKHYAGVYGNLYTLRGRLANEKLDIFPLDHLHYDSYHPLLNDGPDIVDMVDELSLARKDIDAALMQCGGNEIEQARLEEDIRRFTYGEAMVYFYYHLIRTAMLHRQSEKILAGYEFREAEKYAGILQNITDLVAPLPGKAMGDANSNNGFEASAAENVFNYFKKIYGK
jgi:hypothetical protein